MRNTAKHKQTKVSQEQQARGLINTEDFINRAKVFSREMRREIFCCLRIMLEVDKAFGERVFCDDFRDEAGQERANWAHRYKNDLEGLLTPQDVKQNEQWDKDAKERKAKAEAEAKTKKVA
jgi:hypothetical protein